MKAEEMRKFETWERVAEIIGDHQYTYDLSDSSHRLDVVQIVCEALAKIASTEDERGNR